jgi:hypothetical protein
LSLLLLWLPLSTVVLVLRYCRRCKRWLVVVVAVGVAVAVAGGGAAAGAAVVVVVVELLLE